MGNIYKRVLFTVCCVFVINIANAQSSSSPLDDITNAVRYGRTSDISRYLDNVVPITLNNVQSIYSHAQADMVLKDFFSKNTPSDFIVSTNGSGNNNSSFVIGELITANGKYSVYILVKSKDNSFMVQELRFNKE